MVAPPPATPPPGPEPLSGGGPLGARREPPGPDGTPLARSGHARRGSSGSGRTAWTSWLPLGLSTLLLVLFAVVVNRQQVQAERIGELLNRVQDLEHSRALERTAVLEQQLRAMLTRLQSLEKSEQQRSQQASQLQSLQQELQQLRSAAGRPLPPPEPPPPAEVLPRSPRTATPPQPGL